MIEFLYAALAGIVAGITFRMYFRRYVTPSERVPVELEESIEEVRDVDA
jgi:hypothetical protein